MITALLVERSKDIDCKETIKSNVNSDIQAQKIYSLLHSPHYPFLVATSVHAFALLCP